MTNPLPSPYDVLKRWPLATMALSSLILAGDAKHSDDGREPGRGQRLDNERYDEAYCFDKLLRHMVRTFDPAYDESKPATENGLPEEVAIAWHAVQALEAKLSREGHTVESLIGGDGLLEETKGAVFEGSYAYGKGVGSGSWYGGIVEAVDYLFPIASIQVDWKPLDSCGDVPVGLSASVWRKSLTTEKPA